MVGNHGKNIICSVHGAKIVGMKRKITVDNPLMMSYYKF